MTSCVSRSWIRLLDRSRSAGKLLRHNFGEFRGFGFQPKLLSAAPASYSATISAAFQ